MRKLIFLLTFTLLLFYSPALVFADDCSSLPPGQGQVDCYQKVVDSLGLQVNTLAGQITFYDAQIKLVTSKVNQTEDQIVSISTKINSLEDKLQEKSRLLEKQIRLSYKQGQIDPLQVLFSSDDVSQLISRFKYLQIVQSTNRRFLAETQAVQNNYGQQKTLVQDSQKRLQTQKTSLANLRAGRDNLLKQTKASESNYQKLLTQAKAELTSFASFTKGYGLLPPQPLTDGWYYNQRDNRWGGHCIGNTCSGSPQYIWQVGCLITDVAMILKKNGQDVTPLTIAQDTSYFFSNTAYMLHSGLAAHGFTVNGGYNQGLIDSQLAAGKPVIVHLTVNTSDGHYVVLKSGSNGDYVMNDPLTSANLNFKSVYSLSSINQVITYR